MTEVRLDRLWEGGLRKQRNGGGGCASMHERSKRVESPGTYVIGEFQAAISAWPYVLPDHPPVLWWLSHGEGWDAVGINCKRRNF